MRRLLLLSVVALLPGTAETLPRLSLSKLLDGSSAVVHGTIVRHWSAWDTTHEFIWTHYELRPIEVLHGHSAPLFTISEPGGVVGDVGLRVSGSVPFVDGEEVVVFLEKTSSGMLRINGGVQGKLRVVNTVAGKSVKGVPHIVDSVDIDTFKANLRSASAHKELR